LHALLLPVPTDKRIENCEDVTAIFDHAGKNVAEARLALGFAMPFSEDGRRYFDIAAELFGRMATEEETVKKGGLPLRDIEVQRDFRGNKLCHCGHGERAVYRKASRRQVVRCPACCVQDNTVRKPHIRCKLRVGDTTPVLPGRL
jgi:hypothetical protein